MALPDSREFDATDTGPLPHTAINAIQDAIVSEYKEAVIKTIGGGAFVIDANTGANWGLFSHAWQNSTDETKDIYLCVDMPQGAVISEIKFYWTQFAGTRNVKSVVETENILTQTNTVHSTVTDAGGGGAHQQTHAIAKTMAADEVLKLTAGVVSGAADITNLYGVRITYTKHA